MHVTPQYSLHKWPIYRRHGSLITAKIATIAERSQCPANQSCLVRWRQIIETAFGLNHHALWHVDVSAYPQEAHLSILANQLIYSDMQDNAGVPGDCRCSLGYVMGGGTKPVSIIGVFILFPKSPKYIVSFRQNVHSMKYVLLPQCPSEPEKMRIKLTSTQPQQNRKQRANWCIWFFKVICIVVYGHSF